MTSTSTSKSTQHDHFQRERRVVYLDFADSKYPSHGDTDGLRRLRERKDGLQMHTPSTSSASFSWITTTHLLKHLIISGVLMYSRVFRLPNIFSAAMLLERNDPIRRERATAGQCGGTGGDGRGHLGGTIWPQESAFRQEEERKGGGFEGGEK